MNDDQVNDLKQFITTVITQQTSDLREDISGIKQDVSGLKQDVSSLKQDIKHLDQKIDDVDTKLDTIAVARHDRLENHEGRLAKLEQARA